MSRVRTLDDALPIADLPDERVLELDDAMAGCRTRRPSRQHHRLTDDRRDWDWQRTIEIFDAIIELPPAGRAAALDRKCGNAELRHEAERLLAGDDAADEQRQLSPSHRSMRCGRSDGVPLFTEGLTRASSRARRRRPAHARRQASRRLCRTR
jgi:hypothetical protein